MNTYKDIDEHPRTVSRQTNVPSSYGNRPSHDASQGNAVIVAFWRLGGVVVSVSLVIERSWV